MASHSTLPAAMPPCSVATASPPLRRVAPMFSGNGVLAVAVGTRRFRIFQIFRMFRKVKSALKGFEQF